MFTYQARNLTVDDRRPGQYTFDRHAIRTAELTGLIGTGLQYGQFYLEGRYSPGTDINPTTGYDLTINRWAIVAGYRFHRGQ